VRQSLIKNIFLYEEEKMAEKRKNTAATAGIILIVLSFLLFCWPGIMLFDKTGPLFLGLPPMIVGTYLCVILTVIFMSILYRLGVEK